jgi:elongation factor P
MLAKEIKSGAILNYNNAPCLIESVTVQSPTARGAATYYKYRARNLITKQKVDITLKGGDSLDEADFYKRPVKFMYADATDLHFLDQENYEQYSLTKEDVAEESQYLTEDLEGVQALIYNDECVGIQVPVAVPLRIVECDPAIKGASATARTKAAKLQTGLVVQVPEYLSEGELIKVDTRTAEYLSRA